MTEADQGTRSHDAGNVGKTAGEMLKAARLANGVHIAALAASIKVSVQKLELLEADRFDELPDPTFARALAQTVCRFLKVDPVPVLAKLPEPGTPSKLEHVARGLNQPFRDSGSRGGDAVKLSALSRPAVWLPLLLVIAAIVLWLLPPGMLKLPDGFGSAEAPDAQGAATTTVPVMPPTEPAASETVHSAPLVVDPPVASPASAPVAGLAPASAVSPVAAQSGPVVVQTAAESWLEVRDAKGRVLVSRLVAAGETLELAGEFPLRVRIGNAGGTKVTVRGQPFDLTPFVRDNVARFDIK
jgi:cytoskeleton protein RodZ